MNIRAKKPKTVPAGLAMALIVFFAIGGLYLYLWQSAISDVEWSSWEISSRNIKINPQGESTKQIMTSELAKSASIGKYGEWPLGRVILSGARGNPFTAKPR